MKKQMSRILGVFVVLAFFFASLIGVASSAAQVTPSECNYFVVADHWESETVLIVNRYVTMPNEPCLKGLGTFRYDLATQKLEAISLPGQMGVYYPLVLGYGRFFLHDNFHLWREWQGTFVATTFKEPLKMLVKQDEMTGMIGVGMDNTIYFLMVNPFNDFSQPAGVVTQKKVTLSAEYQEIGAIYPIWSYKHGQLIAFEAIKATNEKAVCIVGISFELNCADMGMELEGWLDWQNVLILDQHNYLFQVTYTPPMPAPSGFFGYKVKHNSLSMNTQMDFSFADPDNKLYFVQNSSGLIVEFSHGYAPKLSPNGLGIAYTALDHTLWRYETDSQMNTCVSCALKSEDWLNAPTADFILHPKFN